MLPVCGHWYRYRRRKSAQSGGNTIHSQPADIVSWIARQHYDSAENVETLPTTSQIEKPALVEVMPGLWCLPAKLVFTPLGGQPVPICGNWGGPIPGILPVSEGVRCIGAMPWATLRKLSNSGGGCRHPEVARRGGIIRGALYRGRGRCRGSRAMPSTRGQDIHLPSGGG